jgi:hypothetical protein
VWYSAWTSLIKADPEDVGVGELVHALVEPAEDGLELERRGDLAADLAEQLDVLLALALGLCQRLGRFGPQLGLGQLGALAFLAEQPPALDAVDGQHQHRRDEDEAAVGRPGAVPRRQDGEGVGRLLAHLARRVARPHAEGEVAEAEVRELAARLA